MEHLCEARHHNQRIGKQVSRPRFINEFKANNVGIALEGGCNFFPIVPKLVQQSIFIVPQIAKPLIDSKAKIVLSPWTMAVEW